MRFHRGGEASESAVVVYESDIRVTLVESKSAEHLCNMRGRWVITIDYYYMLRTARLMSLYGYGEDSAPE